ncbi:MAG: class I SAM-dependent methyltransferase [Asticcacaulis sp.]|nr:class I SAM-dependent methyltransferase [Asticcacaulis sp.]
MNLIASTIGAAERLPLPDGLTRAGIGLLVGRTRARLGTQMATFEDGFVQAMGDYPIAAHAEAANDQHYELPPEFFAHVLGPRRKYSCCLYLSDDTTLEQAEVHALRETCRHAGLTDGQTILELGCGWGSLSLYMAEMYPKARIVSVSNSHSQRAYIVAEAFRRGLSNLTVVTADMNDFAIDAQFDRVVSVEMFEHMSNWRALLERARGWMRLDGRLFLHVFTHRSRSYRFSHDDPADWIGKYFFTGGIMPAADLAHRFPDLFEVEEEWRWSGVHYARTANDWLARFDAGAAQVDPILDRVYGRDAALWRRRWRLFFLATAGLFGHNGGNEWPIGHYRLKPMQKL